MKYFKVFNTESEYLEYVASEDFISPNVSTLRDCTNTWITVEVHKYEDDYLTFRALDSGTFSLSANDVQYSLDNGETWATLTAGSSTPTVNSGDTVLWKASNLTATSGVGIGTFSSTGDFEVKGNLLSLVYGDDFENQVPSTSSNKYYFTNLFSGNTNVINAENLVIVGQSLPDEYCRQMFHSCSNLEKIPRVLSASTIGGSTYRAMFNRCSKITTAPSIYATSIYENSMAWMFENCTSLTTPMEELSATTTYAACYQGMFKNCTSLLYTPKLLALKINWSSYEQMFNGCTSLTAITQLSMEETSKQSCMHMFSGCTSLASVPDLHVIKFNGQLGSSLSYMFAGCTSLVTAPALPATNLKTNTTTSEYGVYKGMFQGCTSLTTAPALPATILSSNCYVDMFKGCTSLTTAPSLPAETLTDGCYQSMFYGCTSLTTAPTLSSTTLADRCYYQMFYSCSGLTAAPELPATTLAIDCYYYMFYGCTSLTTAPELPATTLVANCYDSMFKYCSSLTTIPSTLPATTSIGEGSFVSCTNLTSIDIPNSVTSIGDAAFDGCLFENCTIGNGITSIGDGAFYNNSYLNSVTIMATTPPSICSNYCNFGGEMGMPTIYVPSGSVNTYKTASGWSNYTDNIEPIS